MAQEEIAVPPREPRHAAIIELASQNFKSLDGQVIEDRPFVEVILPPANISAAANLIRESEDFDFDLLYDVTGVHWPDDEEIELVYHFAGLEHPDLLVLRTRVPQDRPHVPSITASWPTAGWHEREAMDMFNVVFDGHPYPEPLLLDEDDLKGALLKSQQVRNVPDIPARFRERGGKPFRLWNPVRDEVTPTGDGPDSD